MTRVIKVKPYRTKVMCAGKDTSSLSLSELSETFSEINGQTLLEFEINKNELLLAFENDTFFFCSCKKGLTEWGFHHVKLDDNGFNDCVFEYGSGNQERQVSKNILNSFIGKKIVFYPSKNILFFHSIDRCEYIIESLVNLENDDDIYINLSES